MMRSIRRNLCFALGLAALLSIAGCGGAKEATRSEDDEFLAKLPPVTVSDDLIHSPSGDMTARLPDGWVLLDAARLETPEIFAVACDPRYTMSLVFSELTLDNTTRARITIDALNDLGEISFQRRQKRSAGRAKMIGAIEQAQVGERRFGIYSYSTDSSRTTTRVAVFIAGVHAYECSITPLTFGNHDLPSVSLVRTVHQIVLKSIEW